MSGEQTSNSIALKENDPQALSLLQEELEAMRLAKRALEQQLISTAQGAAEALQQYQQLKNELDAFRQSQDRTQSFLSLAFESMDSLLFITDYEGLITQVNRSTKQTLNLSDDELLGQAIDSLLQVEGTAKNGDSDSVFRSVMQKGHISGHYEFLARTSTQKKLTFLLNGNCLYDKFGKLSGMVFTAINESELSEKTNQLSRTNKLIEMMLDTANDAIIVSDEDDNITTWNTQSEKLFGYTKEDVVGKKLHDLIVSEEDRAAYYKGLMKFRSAGLGPAINTTRQVTAYRKDRSTFDAEVSISSAQIEGKWHAFGVVRDITESNKVARELIEAKSEADKANIAKSQFLATMSHEIRTPLNGIIGMVHLAQKTSLTPEQQDYLNKTDLSAKTLLTIINDILDFSKVEAGKMELELAAFSLQSIKESVLSTIAVKAEEKAIAFDFEISPEVPLDLIGDSVRLNQILLNLCSNAVKFTEKGRVSANVLLSKQGEEEVSLLFDIVDSGIGIAQESIPLLFNSFQQADSSTTRKFGGTGLGLAISQKLANLMGGEIKVESELGKGTRFWFELKFVVNSRFVTQSNKTEQFSKAFDIWLIDDNDLSLKVISSAVKDMRAKVSTFNTPYKALEALQSIKHEEGLPDVLLVDWKMPNMDGLSFIDNVNKLNLPKRPKAILMSSYNTTAQVNASESANLDGVLRKPIDLNKLHHFIEGFEEKEVERSLSGKRVLLVDDVDINLQIAEYLLKELGMKVDTAINGKEAVEKACENSYDLIMMDIHMPVMDGIDATKILRDEKGIDVPIVALTANVMREDIDNYLSVGMNAHLPKPLQPEQMEAVLLSLF